MNSKSASIFERIEEVSREHAEAESQRQYLAEFRKSKKALLMGEAEIESPGITIAKQERYAYSHPEYLELLEGLKVATERAIWLRHQLNTYNQRFEQWRSKQATTRAEMQLR